MPSLETYEGVYIWYYVPSLPAAITVASLFTVISVAHGWRMYKTRMWFCSPFVVGGIFEVIGYAARAAATYTTGSLIAYILQAIFLLLPPVLFAASLYTVYSRLVRAVHGEKYSIISPKWTTLIFVLGDVACLNIQSTGGGMLAKPKIQRLGEYIIIAGLGCQVFLFLGFVWCCTIFHGRFRAHLIRTGRMEGVAWEGCLYMLYGTSLAILLRNVYRVVEFVQGQDGYLQQHEWPTYAFDGVLMLLVMIAFFIWYPSRLIPSSDAMMDPITNQSHAIGDAPVEPTLSEATDTEKGNGER